MRITGDSNINVGNTHNHHGVNLTEFVNAVEARLQLLLKMDSQVEAIAENNRKLTEELMANHSRTVKKILEETSRHNHEIAKQNAELIKMVGCILDKNVQLESAIRKLLALNK